MNTLFGYEPRHVEYWVTSDGRSFDKYEEAKRWEEIINSPEYNKPFTNTCTSKNPFERIDIMYAEQYIG